jgi:hypothetical protein
MESTAWTKSLLSLSEKNFRHNGWLTSVEIIAVTMIIERWVIATEKISKMIPFLLHITNWFSWNAIILQLHHDVIALQCKSCWKHHPTWSNATWKDLVNPFSGISFFPFSTERNHQEDWGETLCKSDCFCHCWDCRDKGDGGAKEVPFQLAQCKGGQWVGKWTILRQTPRQKQ